MSDTLVSARVPRAKKDTAAGILRGLGATASDLVNSAYDFLLAEKRLPGTQANAGDERAFASFVSASTLDVRWPADLDAADYKDVLSRGRLEDYESLA